MVEQEKKINRKLQKLRIDSNKAEIVDETHTATDVDRQRTGTRRDFLKGFGAILTAISVPAIAGCENQLELKDMFFQNFDYRDYPKFQTSDYITGRDQLPISKNEIANSLQTAIDGNLSIKLAITDLFDFEIINSDVLIRLKSENETEIIKILASNGIYVDSVKLTFPQESIIIDIFIQNKRFTIKADNQKMELTENGPNEKTTVIQLPLRQQSGIAKVQSGHHIQLPEQKAPIFLVTSEHMAYGDGTTCSVYEKAPAKFRESNTTTTVQGISSFIQFLQKCKSTEMLEKVLSYGNLDIRDITGISQLIEIFRSISKNPLLISELMKSTIDYYTWDKNYEDEYRHPITTLQSGWGECDDYTIIFYFWAYLQNYKPYIVLLEKNHGNHVISWYQDENQTIYVQSNGNVTKLKAGETIQSHLDSRYDEYEVTMNEHL